MNTQIKTILFLLFAITAINTQSAAQSSVEICRIKYHYDMAGNRIKREYKCEAEPDPSANVGNETGTPIFTNLFPNPTTGIITGIFSIPIGGDAGGAYVYVSTMGAIVVFEQFYSAIASSISFDISQQIPGNYLVTVHAFNKVETYIITKL